MTDNRKSAIENPKWLDSTEHAGKSESGDQITTQN